tara:strand:+ start:391 stop:1077 length:687 start_codon:yes stop_codon:yes gene_type:complete
VADMAKNNVPKKVIEVLKEIGLTPQQAGWDCHGTYVLLHKALEKVAAHRKIEFDAPQILTANVSAKEVVVLVTGRMGELSEWSIGEAAPYNNKNNYPFAMAEKRAKDRVILKLVGLHGDAYSQAEADEFQESMPDHVTAQPQSEPEPVAPEPAPQKIESLDWTEQQAKFFCKICTKNLRDNTTIDGLHSHWHSFQAEITTVQSHYPELYEELKAAFTAQRKAIEEGAN